MLLKPTSARYLVSSLVSVAAVDDPDLIQGHVPPAGWSIDRKERHERDHWHTASPAAIQLPRTTGVKPFFIWVGLMVLGIPLSGYLGWGVAGHVDGVAPALIGGALTGAGIGFAQWLTLRRSLGLGLEWIAATSAGLAIGLAVGASVVGYETSMSQLAIMGAIQGAFVGIAQGMLLRNKFSLWPAWIVAMPVFFSIGWVVTDS